MGDEGEELDDEAHQEIQDESEALEKGVKEPADGADRHGEDGREAPFRPGRFAGAGRLRGRSRASGLPRLPYAAEPPMPPPATLFPDPEIEFARFERGDQGQRDEKRGQKGERDREGRVLEQLTGDAVDVDDRQEDDDRRQGRGHDGGADFLRPDIGRLLQPLAEAAVAEDVLRDDDRAVVEHAHPQGQAAERHDVEGDVAEEEQAERADDGDGDDRADDEGRLPLLEEDEQGQEGQDGALDELVLDGADGVFDRLGLLGDDAQGDAGVLGPDLADRLADELGHLDRVGPGFLADEEADALGPVEPGHALALLDGVVDRGHVAEADDAALLGDEKADVADLAERLELADDAQGVLERALADRPALEVAVEGADPGGHVLDGQPVEGQLLGIGLDLDLALDAARDLGRPDALDLLEARLDELLGQLLELEEGPVAREGQGHDGPALGVEGDDRRALGILGEAVLGVVELLAGVEHGEIHVRAPVELQGQERDPLFRDRLDAAEPRDAADGRFERGGDERLDLLGGDAGVIGDDGQARVADVGQEVDRELPERDGAEEDDGDVEHIHRHRPVDGHAGELHGPSLSPI